GGGTTLGHGLFELGVVGGHLFHAACDLGRVGTGGTGLLGGGVVLLIFLVRVGIVVGGLGIRGFVAGGRRRGGRRRCRRRHRIVEAVGEADHDFGQALLAGLVQFVVPEQVRDRAREGCQGGGHLVQAFLDALGDRDLAFAGQQLDRAHLAHVHAHRVGGAAALAVECGQRGGGLLGGGV